LNVPREELLKRLSGRYICRANQHVYNIYAHPPKVAGICDLDGSELYHRSDDNEEAVQKSLDIYFNETIHLLDYYGSQQKVITGTATRYLPPGTTAILKSQRLTKKNAGP
jgi:adenylate kinase